jgi:hypothetical protein
MYDSPREMAAIFRSSTSMPGAGQAVSREFDRQRESDVAEADDADARLAVLNAFE